MVLVLSLGLILYTRKEKFMSKIKTACCGRGNVYGYEEIKGWVVSFMKLEMGFRKYEQNIDSIKSSKIISMIKL